MIIPLGFSSEVIVTFWVYFFVKIPHSARRYWKSILSNYKCGSLYKIMKECLDIKCGFVQCLLLCKVYKSLRHMFVLTFCHHNKVMISCLSINCCLCAIKRVGLINCLQRPMKIIEPDINYFMMIVLSTLFWLQMCRKDILYFSNPITCGFQLKT